MTVAKSPPPLCRFCGKPIAKKTVAIQFINVPRQGHMVDSKYRRFIECGALPATIQEVRERVHDLEILTVRDHCSKKGIGIAFGWDGHSFHDLYFCNSEHARKFGYTAAINGMSSMAYQKEIRKRYPDATTRPATPPADPALPSWDRWNRE